MRTPQISVLTPLVFESYFQLPGATIKFVDDTLVGISAVNRELKEIYDACENINQWCSSNNLILHKETVHFYNNIT